MYIIHNTLLPGHPLALQDASTTVCGVRVYGTPWQPEYCNWAFNLPRGRACLDKWDLIPADTDVLVSHTPPVGHGDLCCTGVRAGCVDLLSTVGQGCEIVCDEINYLVVFIERGALANKMSTI